MSAYLELNMYFFIILFLFFPRASKYGWANAEDDPTERHGPPRAPGMRQKIFVFLSLHLL